MLAMDISQIIRRFGLGNLSIICSGAALFLCFLKYCSDYGTAIRLNIASAQIIDAQYITLIEVAIIMPLAITLVVLNGIAFYLSIKADEIVPEKKQTLSLGPRGKQALIALLIYMFLGLMFCLAIAIPILIADGVNALLLELYSHSTEYLLYVVIYGFFF